MEAMQRLQTRPAAAALRREENLHPIQPLLKAADAVPLMWTAAHVPVPSTKKRNGMQTKSPSQAEVPVAVTRQNAEALKNDKI